MTTPSNMYDPAMENAYYLLDQAAFFCSRHEEPFNRIQKCGACGKRDISLNRTVVANLGDLCDVCDQEDWQWHQECEEY